MNSSTSVLQTNVLVLNKNYLAVHITTVKRAFTLLCKEIAEVIHIDEGNYNSYNIDSWMELSSLKERYAGNGHKDDWIKTAHLYIKVPRIIRLLFYDKLPMKRVKLNRRNIYARDDNRCQYCGRRFSTTELSIDHVIPRSLGGDSSWENLVCSCTDCNAKKGGRRPRQASMKLIRKPYRPKRSPFIAVKLRSEKYQSWKAFLEDAYWSVELK